MMKMIVNTKNAPQPIGPYSQAIKAKGEMMFISGQIPLDPEGKLAGNDIETQTRQCIINMKAILEEVGGSLDNVVKTTVLLKNMDDFQKMNGVYNEFFENSKPARAAFQVCKLPMDVMVEIEAVAVFD